MRLNSSSSSNVRISLRGNMKFASGLLSLKIAGAGSAEVRAVQSARSLLRRSSRMRSCIDGMVRDISAKNRWILLVLRCERYGALKSEQKHERGLDFIIRQPYRLK